MVTTKPGSWPLAAPPLHTPDHTGACPAHRVGGSECCGCSWHTLRTYMICTPSPNGPITPPKPEPRVNTHTHCSVFQKHCGAWMQLLGSKGRFHMGSLLLLSPLCSVSLSAPHPHAPLLLFSGTGNLGETPATDSPPNKQKRTCKVSSDSYPATAKPGTGRALPHSNSSKHTVAYRQYQTYSLPLPLSLTHTYTGINQQPKHK